METLLYAMTFPPIVIVALVIHEAGHMAAAKLLHIKVMGFQIGMGRRLAVWYTGGTKVRLSADQRPPAPGQVIHYWAQNPPEEETEATQSAVLWQPALMAIRRRRKQPRTEEEEQIIEEATRFNQQHPRFTGRVKEVQGDLATVADTAWTVALVPIMAMVHVAEDPKNTDPGYFNTASWAKQMFVIFAGVGANLALLGIIIMALAAAPIGSEGQQVLVIEEVERRSPAELAGLLPGDVITRAGKSILPTPEQLREEISEAAQKGEYLLMTVSRDGEPINTHVLIPEGRTTVGVAYLVGEIANKHDQQLLKRFMRLGETYMMSLAYLFQKTPAAAGVEDQPKVSGMVAAAYYTAVAVETAQFQAWLAMLGVITWSMAMINILPVPPLDGYQIVLYTFRALRGGRPLNTKVEHAIGMSGMAAIMAGVLYLTYQDIIHILS